MNNKIIKYSLLFFFSFLFLTIIQLLYYGNRLDYFWNYNNSLQISNGLVPYKDINIITTPLFHFITSFFLYIFGKNLFVYASLMSILKIFHIVLISKIVGIICYKNKIKKVNTINIFTYVIGIILLYNLYYEYNLLAVFFISLITYLELLDKKDFKYNFLIGSIAALSFLSKQSIGLFAILFVLIKPFIFKDNKENILYRLIGIIWPLIIFVIYLLLTNSFDAFLSYCLYGLKEFNNAVSFIDSLRINHNGISFSSVITVLLFIVAFGVLIYQFYLLFKNKYDNNRKIVLFYSIACFSCFYPIRDLHHLLPALISILPLITYHLIEIRKNKPINKPFKYLLVIIGIELSLIPINMYISVYNNHSKEYVVLKDDYKYINGIVVKKALKENIDTVVKFELENKGNGKSTIILNKSSVVYHLAQGKYLKDYDLFMRGNFGENGEERLINEIKEKDNVIYLIDVDDINNTDLNFNQLPDSIIDYVLNNLNKKEDLLFFKVYEK